MALPTNTFRTLRYYRSKFRESKYLLAAEATDLQLESFEQLRQFVKNTYGDIAVGPAFRVDKLSGTTIVIRPGEAWLDGIPFLLKSGTDAVVNPGVLPTNTDTSLFDMSATPTDIGGKRLVFPPTVANDNYSVVIEAIEELVREAGSSGAVDAFLQGVNVGEGTEHKLRLVYKTHVVKTADLTETPTFPLIPAITNHFVNRIKITPAGLSGTINTAITITPDINGADLTANFNNGGFVLPFAADASDYIFGRLIDSDGNVLIITSITTSDGGMTVDMRLDREVKVGDNDPKAGLPVITASVPYYLVKRDHYTTDSNGSPLGKRFYRVADFNFTSPVVGDPTDKRVSSNINTFGVDPNIRLREGGIISWNASFNLLTNSSDYEITTQGMVGKAKVAAGSITLPLTGDVAYVYLNRQAIADYFVVPTVTAKTNVPSSVDVYILAERGSQRVYFPHNGSIGDSETGFLGGFGSELAKDLSRDNLTDMLTEVEMDEVFAETFDIDDDVDYTKTQSMVFEPFNKQFKAGSSARFLDFFGDTVPELDPTDPWTLLGTQTSSSLLGIVTLTDASAGDFIDYERVESSLTTLARSEHRFRARVPSSSGSHPFTYRLKDGVGGKHFGLSIGAASASLIDGAGTILQTFVLDGTIYHEYKLTKIGNTSIQWYVDEVLKGVYRYSDIVTGSGGVSTVTWGTGFVAASTAVVNLDFLRFDIYTSIFFSKDLYRKGSVFYEADVLPTAATPVWVKVDGGGGITEVITNGNLVLTDTIGANQINYYRDETSLTRHGDAEVDLRVKIASAGLASFEQFGIVLEDGAKTMAAYLRDVAGQLKVGLWNPVSNIVVGPEHNLDYNKFYSIKIRKGQDETVSLLVDNVLTELRSYDEFLDPSVNTRISFGSFFNASQYTATIDFTQYGLPGFGTLAGTPVKDFLVAITSDDPAPVAWVSSDNGFTWFRLNDRDAVSVADTQQTGANLLVQIGLSKINSVLTDYGLYYNRSGFETDGPFRFDTQTAIAAQTTFELPFVYSTGVDELIVTYKPVAGDSRELFLTDDYTEDDQNHITLTFPAVAGDKLKFRVIFVTSPIIVPTAGVFNGHDHDGSGGESDILNPTTVNAVGDVNVGNNLQVDVDANIDGDLTVAGTINGTSPLKLSGDNTGVLVGNGTLAVGSLDLKVRTAGGASPTFSLERGGVSWTELHNAAGNFVVQKATVDKLRIMTDGSLEIVKDIRAAGSMQIGGNAVIAGIVQTQQVVASQGQFDSLTVGGQPIVTVANFITVRSVSMTGSDVLINPGLESTDVVYKVFSTSSGEDLDFANGGFDGQKIFIYGLVGSQTFNIQEPTGGAGGAVKVMDSGSFTIDDDDTISFIWNQTDLRWLELQRSNNN